MNMKINVDTYRHQHGKLASMQCLLFRSTSIMLCDEVRH